MNGQDSGQKTEGRKQKTKKRFLALAFLIVVMVSIVAVFLWNKGTLKEIIAQPSKVVFCPVSALRGWYPADANVLSRQIEGLFQKADVKPIDDVIALILPHAGYAYSGQTAADALKTTNKKYKRIVVIGPNHHAYMEEHLSVVRADYFETILGQIPLDVEFIDNLLKYPMFRNLPNAFHYENSIEVELPLLQYRYKDFKLVPITTGQCSLDTIKRVGTILQGLIDQQTLVIASSDFTHYGPAYRYVPFKENIPEQIKKLDMGAYEYIAKLDSEGFFEYRHKTGATICGYIPIAVLLSMLGKDTKVSLANYATSGELTGDFTNSVSYLSVVFSGEWKNRPDKDNLELTEGDKKQLLALARKTISFVLQNKRAPRASELDVVISDALSRPRAAFVTLNKNSQLRGCVGGIYPRQALYKSVISNAINAAFHDDRFTPVSDAEYKDITIEISVLTVPQSIDSYNKIRIGTDGVILSKNGHLAVFLPQVAPEWGWDLNQMLTQLSLKAGLPPDAWKEGASFLVFQADVFGEEP
jgi:AmmeMemoRadiSam system protein B/AmmeMemoRadiSam system protein A